MLIKAEQRNSRQSPRKVRLVANAIKDMAIPQAMTQLGLMDQKGSLVVMKVLNQAVANATKNLGLNINDLVIKEVLVNEGPRYRRYRAVSRGRAHNIIKKTCHVRVVLESKAPAVEAKPETKAPKAEAPKTEEKKAEKTVKKPAAKKTAAKKSK